MSKSNYFKRYIQQPLIVLVLLLLVLGGVFYGASQFETTLNQRQMETKDRLDSLMRQVLFLREQYQLSQQYGERYQQLIKEGLSKEQDRVRWTDLLLQEKPLRWIHPITVQFEPQKLVQGNDLSLLKANAPIFYQTQVNLVMNTPLDTDVFSVLEDIEQHISPFFLLKSCSIQQQRDQNNVKLKMAFNKSNNAFEVNCALVLFNSKPRPFKSPKGEHL